MLELNKIYNMDCLDGMKQIDDDSIDMILCDLPYGTTDCKWDKKIPIKKLWSEYKRICKTNCTIVLTAVQPFASELINSNKSWFKYEWIWVKNRSTTFFNVKESPLKIHENILIFYNGKSKYNPQKEYVGKKTTRFKFIKNRKPRNDGIYGDYTKDDYKKDNGYRFPIDILEFSISNSLNKQHPTEKPIELFEYLIKTYSNDGDVVLDNCMGSGTTAVACKRLNRRFIGFEVNKEFYNITLERLLNVPRRLEYFVQT